MCTGIRIRVCVVWDNIWHTWSRDNLTFCVGLHTFSLLGASAGYEMEIVCNGSLKNRGSLSDFFFFFFF